MKLAEALLLRADRNRTFEQLRARIAASARYQEGEQPPENANDLIAACSAVLDELERLVRQINQTNAGTLMPDGRTVTDALAERDVLRLRYSLLTSAADAASGSGQRGIMMRATRSELKVVTDLDISDLRQRAAEAARRTRELDAQIQQVNWTTELVEP
ncbi:MAG: DIP1984 family protein [Actinomycetota bacterium]|jgi:hypothetical protein|nr:DIP1984 family protein [Actinomycetota bacterium]